MKRLVRLSAGPIAAPEALSAVADASAGAVNLFIGTTRSPSEGRTVRALTYEAYEPMAVRLIEALVDDAARRWPLAGAAVLHRTGTVPAGEPSVVIAVSASHRGEAFDACRFLIDRLKADVPIWKREEFADGGSAWAPGAEPARSKRTD